jgi:endonuclease G, mitochondrial
MTASKNKAESKSIWLWLGLLFIIALVIGYNYWYREQSAVASPPEVISRDRFTKSSNTPEATNNANNTIPNTTASVDPSLPAYLPSHKGEIVKHAFYTLSYNERYEQAEWVCYELTKEILRRPNVPRSDWFEKDPMVSTGSATHYDYKGSGYTRGHLAPAGDMSFDQQAMVESFYMSNMTPQLRGLNNGIWRELEEQSRDWVYQNNKVVITSGPVFYNAKPRFFKKGKVAIPDAFFKVLIDLDGKEKKGIAFIIPHEVSTQHLRDFAMSIDDAEVKTGVDFHYLLKDGDLETVESSLDLTKWPISEDRYSLRVQHWNAQ